MNAFSTVWLAVLCCSVAIIKHRFISSIVILEKAANENVSLKSTCAFTASGRDSSGTKQSASSAFNMNLFSLFIMGEGGQGASEGFLGIM